jgi:hypothetical protein
VAPIGGVEKSAVARHGNFGMREPTYAKQLDGSRISGYPNVVYSTWIAFRDNVMQYGS